MDVAFGDDQMRARTDFAAHNLSLLKHISLNLIRLDPVKQKGEIKARRLIASTSDDYRAQLLGLDRSSKSISHGALRTGHLHVNVTKSPISNPLM